MRRGQSCGSDELLCATVPKRGDVDAKVDQMDLVYV